MRHTISVLVENKFGVLSRISGLFSGRGYNIESLSVNKTMDVNISTMTIVTTGDADVIEQIIKQLRKLVNVLRVRDVSEMEHIEREMMLVKVRTEKSTRSEIFNVVGTFRAKTVDITNNSLVIEITGDRGKILAFLKVLEPYGIIEVVRTGAIALSRGSKATSDFK
ncbi:acetolactate synthase, small subunit [Denitrovibrio acetiphilus DSM 12809]|jgi:acetolactate synthase-1/3 small subunit|uniref:Acetolactate synthase small subunit n=1 Tax=Denitrovibrio acetiphilus (strain DSM 12809 / NBRC 114555 / N2460) TaxID=522772 RepID=D4H3D1_DENA2|nr:acetolactate synthase small subunit [Denitrovibrio acetiphilus]ADD67215.1 acetolactate synthase, small subunit [Denitrovibrio acetiphilus DSM 12809]